MPNFRVPRDPPRELSYSTVILDYPNYGQVLLRVSL